MPESLHADRSVPAYRYASAVAETPANLTGLTMRRDRNTNAESYGPRPRVVPSKAVPAAMLEAGLIHAERTVEARKITNGITGK